MSTGIESVADGRPKVKGDPARGIGQNSHNAGIHYVPTIGERLSRHWPKMLLLVPVPLLLLILTAIGQIAPNGIPLNDKAEKQGIIVRILDAPKRIEFISQSKMIGNRFLGRKLDANAECMTISASVKVPTGRNFLQIKGKKRLGRFQCGATFLGFGVQTEVVAIDVVRPINCDIATFVEWGMSCVPTPPDETYEIGTKGRVTVELATPVNRSGQATPFQPIFLDPPKPSFGSALKAENYYPPSALEGELEGDVLVEIAFNKDGAIRYCDVIKQSGVQVLDLWSCDLAGSHPLFTKLPPKLPHDADGGVTVRQLVKWRIAES